MLVLISALFTVDWCRTQGGIFTTPGEAYTTPVEMWLKGLGGSHIFFGASTEPKLHPMDCVSAARFGNMIVPNINTVT